MVETFGDAGAEVSGGANGDVKTKGLSSPTTRVGGVIGVAEVAGRGESRPEAVRATEEGANTGRTMSDVGDLDTKGVRGREQVRREGRDAVLASESSQSSRDSMIHSIQGARRAESGAVRYHSDDGRNKNTHHHGGDDY